MDVLGFVSVLDHEEEDRLVGIVLELPVGVAVHLESAPETAAALRGFSILGLSVGGREDLEAWRNHFDTLGVEHSPIVRGPRGWCLQIEDPDGLQIHLHTGSPPTPD
jgi:hypothetical protein